MKKISSLSHEAKIPAKKTEPRERVIRKSYTLIKQDLANIRQIQDKCLNKKVVLNDSHVIRLGLELASKLSEVELIKASQKVPKIITGRPKSS